MSRAAAAVMAAIRRSSPREHAVKLAGGLNLAASSLEILDGQCVQLSNYEINTQGDYQSFTGFERFDGRPAPSAAVAPNGPYTDDDTELADLMAEREARRSAISAVPGVGPVRGVFYFDDVCYAFRDDTDAAACNLYKSSATGWQLVTTPPLQPGGRYSFRKLNFPDRAGSEIVGVDGKNHAFIFDGEVYTEIVNDGMDAIGDDKPIALEVLPSDYLILAYAGGSLQWSALGDPLNWDVANGAGELRVVDEITELDLQAQDTLAIYCRNRTYALYGRIPPNFQLTNLNTNTGAITGTVQTIGDSVFVDDRGLTRLSRVQEFGNFNMTTMSQAVDPLLGSYRSRVRCSITVREKNQYRLFFDDGKGLTCTFYGGEVLGFTTFDFGASRVANCTCNAEMNDGSEVVFFGGDDGFVYQMERGTSFDSDEIITVLRTAFSDFGEEGQGIRKRLTRTTLEVKTVDRVTLRFMPEFDYNAPEQPEHILGQLETVGGGGYWSQGVYDATYWSAATIYRAPVHTTGTGANVSAFVRTVSDRTAPHVIAAVVYRYIPLGLRR